MLGSGTLFIGIGVALFTRLLLVQAGRFKGALLSRFQRYDTVEMLYNPLRDGALALGTFLLGIAFALTGRDDATLTLYAPAAAAFILAWMAHRWRSALRRFTPQPAWYTELLARTSRSERRRIAYGWLGLPWAMRQRLNARDEAFLAWADLVIVATVESDADLTP